MKLFSHKKNNENKEYYVNRNIGLCTNSYGENGAPCKHQFFVSRKLKKNLKFVTLSADVNQNSFIAFHVKKCSM